MPVGNNKEKAEECYDELSRIVSFDSIGRLIKQRVPGTLLRPIVIDGPLIGMSYDKNYTMDERLSNCSNYARRPLNSGEMRQGFEMMIPYPYPIKALLKILFHFIARGHKATAFLPIFFSDFLDKACASKYADKFSDMKQFRELFRLKLLKFIPGENFTNYLKQYTMESRGVLVTTEEALYFKGTMTSREGDLKRGSLSEKAAVTTASPSDSCSAFDNLVKESYDLVYSTLISETRYDMRKLPVIIPLFRPFNRRLIISLDAIRSQKVLEVSQSELPATKYNRILSEEQLTLEVQCELLGILSAMLADDFPCGPQDAQIVPRIRHVLGLPSEGKLLKQREEANAEK